MNLYVCVDWRGNVKVIVLKFQCDHVHFFLVFVLPCNNMICCCIMDAATFYEFESLNQVSFWACVNYVTFCRICGNANTYFCKHTYG